MSILHKVKAQLWKSPADRRDFQKISLKISENPLTKSKRRGIIVKRCEKHSVSNDGNRHGSYGGIAQLARATGSYPVGHRFKSGFRYHPARWSRGLRHRPFTAVTAVRICYGSPNTKGSPSGLPFVFDDTVCDSDCASPLGLALACGDNLGNTPTSAHAAVQNLLRVTKKIRQSSQKVVEFFIQARRAWHGINSLRELYGIAPQERMASCGAWISPFLRS